MEAMKGKLGKFAKGTRKAWKKMTPEEIARAREWYAKESGVPHPHVKSTVF